MEQGTHKPLVVGSSPTLATSPNSPPGSSVIISVATANPVVQVGQCSEHGRPFVFCIVAQKKQPEGCSSVAQYGISVCPDKARAAGSPPSALPPPVADHSAPWC